MIDAMTRWKKDETEFNVKLSPDGRDSKICRVPKPVRDFLDNPKSVKFVIDGNCISFDRGD